MMDSLQSTEYLGLKVSAARLTVDQQSKSMEQLFRCAAFKVSSTAPELVGTIWLSFFNRKKQFCYKLRRGDIYASVLSHPG